MRTSNPHMRRRGVLKCPRRPVSAPRWGRHKRGEDRRHLWVGQKDCSPIAACRDRKSTRLHSSHLVVSYAVFFLNDTATTEIYTLSLHDALPICWGRHKRGEDRRHLWVGHKDCSPIAAC